MAEASIGTGRVERTTSSGRVTLGREGLLLIVCLREERCWANFLEAAKSGDELEVRKVIDVGRRWLEAALREA